MVTLKLSDFLAESGANNDQGTTDYGATPPYIAAQNGHDGVNIGLWMFVNVCLGMFRVIGRTEPPWSNQCSHMQLSKNINSL